MGICAVKILRWKILVGLKTHRETINAIHIQHQNVIPKSNHRKPRSKKIDILCVYEVMTHI